MIGVDDVTDFLRQMEIATLDGESPLCEIPLGPSFWGTPSYTARGRQPPARRSSNSGTKQAGSVCTPGLPPGWNLIPADWCTRLVDGDALAGPDAEELLDHPERWVREHADGYVVPCKTWQGEVAPWEQWLAEALDTAQRLPLRTHDPEP
jgi:hypothetical protein